MTIQADYFYGFKHIKSKVFVSIDNAIASHLGPTGVFRVCIPLLLMDTVISHPLETSPSLFASVKDLI